MKRETQPERAFPLIELLVVIARIGPARRRALACPFQGNRASDSVACVHNLRQIGLE